MRRRDDSGHLDVSASIGRWQFGLRLTANRKRSIIMSDMVPRQSTAPSVIYDDDPYAAFAHEVNQRNIVGKLLKFSKGDWSIGQDNEEIEVGTEFIANMEELLRGWIRWDDGKPVDHIMGKVSRAFQPPKRPELGFLDEDEWDTDLNNLPRDPWQESYYLLLKGTGELSEELFTFAASSKGGRDAVSKLCEDFSKGRRKQAPDMFPVVAVDVGG